MGRETVAVCRWQGQSAEVRVLLESEELILRGDIKAKIPRSTIGTVQTIPEGLVIQVQDASLIMELGSQEAARWAAALAKAPPTLAQKLGLNEQTAVFVLGSRTIAELEDTLKERTVPSAAEADQIVAIVHTENDLHAALQVLTSHPQTPVWFVYQKGPRAQPGDAAVRTLLRGQGWIDTKACAVSRQWTATRYQSRERN